MEERLRYGVVPAVALAAHALDEAPLRDPSGEVAAGVLDTTVGVDDQSARRISACDGPLQCLQSDDVIQRTTQGPADDAPRKQVDENHQIQPSTTDAQIGVGSDRSALPASRRVGFYGPPSEPDVRLSPHPALRVFLPLGRGSCRSACPWCGDSSSPIAVPSDRHPHRAKQLDLAVTDLPSREEAPDEDSLAQSDMSFTKGLIPLSSQISLAPARLL